MNNNEEVVNNVAENLATENVNDTTQDNKNAETVQNATAAQINENAEAIAKLNADLEKANVALTEAKEECLRAQAEVQNMRRRCEQDVDKAKKFALDRFAKDLIPAIEPLEKALEFADRENEATKNLIQGVELTFNLLCKALNDNNIQVINPEGQSFDPTFHQAIQYIPDENIPADHVIKVVRKGYALNDRVLQAALVIVSSGSANKGVDAAV